MIKKTSVQYDVLVIATANNSSEINRLFVSLWTDLCSEFTKPERQRAKHRLLTHPVNRILSRTETSRSSDAMSLRSIN